MYLALNLGVSNIMKALDSLIDYVITRMAGGVLFLPRLDLAFRQYTDEQYLIFEHPYELQF